MSKRGSKSQCPDLKLIKGTDRPDRQSVPAFKELDGEPVRPKWLKGPAKKIWHEKIARYKERGQNVVGFEGALAQYCALEAEIAKLFMKGMTPATSMINTHRIYAGDFFDTPASQVSKLKLKKSDNPWSKHVR